MEESITDSGKDETPKGMIRAYQKLFKSKDGKIVLEHLRKCFQTDQPAFQMRIADDAGKQPVYGYDPIHAALKDGARSVLIHIDAIKDAEISPDDEEEKKPVKVKK